MKDGPLGRPWANLFDQTTISYYPTISGYALNYGFHNGFLEQAEIVSIVVTVPKGFIGNSQHCQIRRRANRASV